MPNPFSSKDLLFWVTIKNITTGAEARHKVVYKLGGGVSIWNPDNDWYGEFTEEQWKAAHNLGPINAGYATDYGRFIITDATYKPYSSRGLEENV